MTEKLDFQGEDVGATKWMLEVIKGKFGQAIEACGGKPVEYLWPDLKHLIVPAKGLGDVYVDGRDFTQVAGATGMQDTTAFAVFHFGFWEDEYGEVHPPPYLWPQLKTRTAVNVSANTKGRVECRVIMRYNSKNPFKVRPTPAVGQSTYMHPLMLASTPAPDISPSRIKAVSGMDAQAASSSIGSSSMVADSAGSPTVKVEDEASLELEMPDVPTVQDAQGAVQGVELCAGTEGQTEDAGRQDVEAGGVNIKGKKRQGSPTLDERDTKRPTMTTPDVAQSGPASGSASAEKPIPAPLKKHALAAPASPTAGTQRSPRKAAEDFFDLYPKRHYGPDGERLASGAPPSGSAAVTGTEPQVTVATVPSEPAESSARDSASEPTNTSNDAQTSATSSALTSDHHSPSTSVPLTDATDAEKGSSQAAQPAAGTSVSVEVGPGQQDASGGTSSTESESSNNDHQPSPVTGDARGALDSSAPAQPTATPNAAEVKTEAVEHVGQAIVSADEDHSASDQSMETVQAVIPQADTALSRPDTETISTAGSAAAIDDVDQTDSVVITPGYYGKGEDWWTDSRFANREHSVLVPPCEIPLRFYLAEGFPPGLKNVLRADGHKPRPDPKEASIIIIPVQPGKTAVLPSHRQCVLFAEGSSHTVAVSHKWLTASISEAACQPVGPYKVELADADGQAEASGVTLG